MKFNRTFCLDLDVIQELKKKSNQSYLVNKLLKQYLFDNEYDHPTILEASTIRIARALHERTEDSTLQAVLTA